MARKRNSRAGDARVQGAIRLIKSLPTIRRTRTTNPTGKLTPKQYGELLKIIEDNEDFPDKLRFEYTHSKQQFEIRMVTSPLHEGIVGEFNEHFILWKAELKKSEDSIISQAAATLRSRGNEDIEYPVPEEATDVRSPDGGIKHKCRLPCLMPAMVFEVEFSNKSKRELRDKAEECIIRSNGAIRTVVGIYMGEMYAAERKNERRLRKMYRTGQIDESGTYSYATDEENTTGEASIMVWRATVKKNNTLTIGRVQEKKFRDTTGDAVKSVPLRILLEDCVCKVDIDLAKRSKAPPLEISSEALCEAIQSDLQEYRMKRAEVVRVAVEKKKREKREEEEGNQREEERRRRATEIRAREPVEVIMGRIFEQGKKSFSARIMGKKSQTKPE